MKELSLSTISLEIFTNTLEHSEKKEKKKNTSSITKHMFTGSNSPMLLKKLETIFQILRRGMDHE